MPWFQLKMHQSAFDGRTGELTALPRPPSWIQGVLLVSRREGNALNFVSIFGDRSPWRFKLCRCQFTHQPLITRYYEVDIVQGNRTIYSVVWLLYFYNKTHEYDNVGVAPRTLVKAVLNVSSTSCDNHFCETVLYCDRICLHKSATRLSFRCSTSWKQRQW